MNQLEALKQRLFRKQKDWDIIDTWSYLMLHYGWIPYDEFLELDAGIVDKLVNNLNEIHKKNKPRGKK